MTDSPTLPDLEELAAELTAADRERLSPPPEIWAGIEAATADDDQLVAPTSLADRRRRRRGARPSLVFAAAAVALVVLGVAGVLVLLDDADEGEVLVASATITNDGLPVLSSETAEASLIEVDGHFELDLEVPELAAVDGFYEVWIIDTDVQGMYSLGVVTGSSRFVLPPGVDPADFPVVDVSVEPPDGNPTHSGQSIWRGVFEI